LAITGVADDQKPTVAEQITLIRWHLDRYDRLRASTASRASVVLSAGAVLLAGNALVLSQVIGRIPDSLPTWGLALFTAATTISAVLVVLTLLRASRVLVTGRDSRSMFGGPDSLPVSLVFNGTDTVDRLHSFDEFRGALGSQRAEDILEAAQVELWIGIQQHRHRYLRLRGAVRVLRYAGVAFLTILAGALSANVLATM
jgi:hypothetical protein